MPLHESDDASGSQTFQETINEAVHHVLVNQLGVLINTLTNLIKEVDGRPPEKQAGPTYFLVEWRIGVGVHSEIRWCAEPMLQ